MQAKPAIPNRNSDGISTIFLPKRSAKIPVNGVRKTPGSVKATIKPLWTDIEITDNIRKGRCDAGYTHHGDQRNAKNNVEVFVFENRVVRHSLTV